MFEFDSDLPANIAVYVCVTEVILVWFIESKNGCKWKLF